MSPWLIHQPWLALLGWLPPVWLAGVIRTWGDPAYNVTLIDLFDVSVDIPATLWWPSNLHRRAREARRYR